MAKRPRAVAIVGLLYIVAGSAGFVYHLKDADRQPALDWVAVEFIRLVAVVAGAFLLRGQNWARWTALAWMVLHVVLSAFHAWTEFLLHAVLFAGIALLLFRVDASRYFASGKTAST